MVMIHKSLYFLCILCLLALSIQGQSCFENFITARGDQLYDGKEIFRFISFNIPNLLTVEDNVPFAEKNAWRFPDEYEIQDALNSILAMGGSVARTYVITVKREDDGPEIPRFVLGPNKFNEKAFQTMDMVLAIANRLGIRLLIPLVDNWKWMGGKPQYAQFRNQKEEDFWHHPQIKEDYKATLKYILTRKNTITGVAYKDDKAILAWELGNELRDATPEWITEMAKFIKSHDQNHIINDGIQYENIQDYLTGNPYIDILSSHHYEPTPDRMIENIKSNIEKARGKKPYYIGEFGFISTQAMRFLLDSVIQEPSVAGALIWSLRFHNRDGGFYWHTEPCGNRLYKAYHFPGFPSGNSYDETNVISLFIEKAAQIQNRKPVKIQKPQPPHLLPIHDVGRISWQGSTGAQHYLIERSFSPEGGWETISNRVCDAAISYGPLFHDETAETGKSYYYRVKAWNYAGYSDPSNIAGPVLVDFITFADELENYGRMYSWEGNLSFKTDFCRSFKEDFHRIEGEKGSEIVYRVPKPVYGFSLLSFAQEDKALFSISLSRDGKDYQEVVPKRENYFPEGKDYDYWLPIAYKMDQIQGNSLYLKIRFLCKSQIGRVEIQYGK